MPAYRSDAEGEIRTAVVARLRQLRPDARVMHEVNASSFGNRIDVLAVDRAEIIAVEIKSAKDKLDRLGDQMKAMRGCAHHSIAALHEKFLVEREVGRHAADYERDGKFFIGEAPKHAPSSYEDTASTWVFPERQRGPWNKGWRDPKQVVQQPLPSKALDMLWRDELRLMCHRFNVAATGRATMGFMATALRWSLTGRELTLGICAALRERACVEADAPIQWRDAA